MRTTNEVCRSRLSKLEHKQDRQTHSDKQTGATERITTAAFTSGKNLLCRNVWLVCNKWTAKLRVSAADTCSTVGWLRMINNALATVMACSHRRRDETHRNWVSRRDKLSCRRCEQSISGTHVIFGWNISVSRTNCSLSSFTADQTRLTL